MRRLGRFDVVYSWGVLHHTGAMWEALDVVSGLVAVGGRLAIALYIDQGLESRLWLRVKRLYNAGPVGKAAVVGAFVPMFALRGLLADVVRLQPPAPRHPANTRSYAACRACTTGTTGSAGCRSSSPRPRR